MRADHTQSHTQGFNEGLEAAAQIAMKPFLPFSLGGDLIMDPAQGEVTATAIRKLKAAPPPNPSSNRAHIEAMRGDPGPQR